MGIPPLKHVIDGNATSQNAFTTQVVQIAVGTINPNSYTTPAQVRNGSLIRKITLQFDYIDQQVSALDTMDWYIWFNIGGAQARPDPVGTNPSVLKNQIFHQDGALSMQLQATAVSTYVPWVNKWRLEIAVPRAFQQVNENDTIELVYRTTQNAGVSNFKWKIIYKEIFP